MPSIGNLAHSLVMCPDLEPKQQPFGVLDDDQLSYTGRSRQGAHFKGIVGINWQSSYFEYMLLCSLG